MNDAGEARMVDVGAKPQTARAAVAEAWVRMRAETLRLVVEGGHHKGDVFAVARIAGIQAAKRCAELIPLCHPLGLDAVELQLDALPEQSAVRIRAECRLHGRTGVEMEALTAVSVAALTVYDMCKGAEKGIVVGPIELVAKSGGKSGGWTRPPAAPVRPARRR